MFKDFILAYTEAALNKALVANAMINEEGEPVMGLPHTPAFNSGETSLFIVRCKEQDEISFVSGLTKYKPIEILGEVIDGKYVFNDDEARIKYEKLVKVGEFLGKIPVLNEEGNLQLDEDGNLLTEPSNQPYMIGLFA